MGVFEALFVEIEEAIDAHPKLRRADFWDPVMKVSRGRFEVEILVRLNGSRKNATTIHGNGSTAKEAVEHLIGDLDTWAKVI